MHTHEVEEIASLAVGKDRTVDKDHAGEQLDFDGRVDLVEKSRSSDFVVHIEVESDNVLEKLVADTGANGGIPVGNHNTVEWRWRAVSRGAHILCDGIGDSPNFSHSVIIGETFGECADIDATNDISGWFVQRAQRFDDSGLKGVQNQGMPFG